MIKVNNKLYDKCKEYEIYVGNYWVSNGKNKRFGKAPKITFYTEDCLIGIETNFDLMYFKALDFNKEELISRYVTAVYYDSKDGGGPLSLDDIKCIVKRISDNCFNIKLNLVDSDFKEDLVIAIDEEVEIDIDSYYKEENC